MSDLDEIYDDPLKKPNNDTSDDSDDDKNKKNKRYVSANLRFVIIMSD